MKKITMAFALIVATMATSCQKDEPTGVGEGSDGEVGYVSFSIDTAYTRSGGTDNGTEDESTVNTLAIVAFDYNYDFVGSYEVKKSDNGFVQGVAVDARRFFVVTNPSAKVWTAINAISAYNQSQFSALPAISMVASEVSTDNSNGFTMVNCGSKNASGILLESLVSVSTELGTTEDKATEVTIAVDRMVSKFDFSVSSDFDDNTADKFSTYLGAEAEAKGAVLGVALTATNKASYLYSMIYTNALTNNNVYRTDHNMTVGQSLSEAGEIITALEENFNWLKNEDEVTDAAFISPADGTASSSPEYVLENTCEPSYSDSNNLTQAIVKAQYNPIMSSGLVSDLGKSWFKMYTNTGTLYLTFDEVVDLYNGDPVYGVTLSEESNEDKAIKASMDKQLQNIMNDSEIAWDNGELTIEKLDACEYGGYKAATVGSTEDSVGDSSDYVLQYYQKAINYYNIFIQHDSNIGVDHVGRWGMVRNNSYSMSITGIMQEGLPYIPDPTDPQIVDPENPDPENPDPADESDAYIAVTISVNPWVIWSQESPLM